MSDTQAANGDAAAGEFKLHCFAQSGNAYKAALMLELCGAGWTPVFVDFFHGATRAAPFRALNPLGEVPVLQHGDVTLTQSGVILDYLSQHFDRFRGPDPAGRREVLRWLFWDNHKLTGYTATYRFLKCFARTADPAVTGFLWDRCRTAYGILDAHLAERAFVAAEQPTIADLSVCGYLFWPEEIGVDWGSDYPGIAAWLERIAALPGWRHPYDLMPGHPLPPPA